MQQVLVEATVQLGPAIDARELDLGESLPRLDAVGLEAMAASSFFTRWLVWLVCIVLAAIEVVWRITVAVMTICVEVTGRCPEAARARAMEVLSIPSRRAYGLTCVQVAASKRSVAIVLMRGQESWLVLVRRVVDGGQEWRTETRRVEKALPILCWRDDERLSVAHGRRLVTFGLGGEIVEEVDDLLDAGRCVGGGFFSTQLWVCSSLGVLRARNVADARVGWPVRCCSANTRRHEVAMCGLHDSLGIWRFEKQRWIAVATRHGTAPTVNPSIFAKDWVRCVTVLDATPPLRPSVEYRGEESGILRLAVGLLMDAMRRLAFVDALASTLVSVGWAAAPRKLLSSSEIISAEGGLEIDGKLLLPGLIDATPWNADDHRNGLVALTAEGLFFVAPNVCEVVLEERISGSALCSPLEMATREWFAVVADDGRVAVLVKASEVRVVERAAKSSLAAAIAIGRRHGARSERMAREARWRLARDVAALVGCDDRDTDALEFVLEASSSCVLNSADNIREAHRAGERAAQLLGIRSLALERAARRLALYEACIAAEHEPFVETDEGQQLHKDAKAGIAALSLAIDAAARTACSAMSWDFFIRSSDDELIAALAARGRVAALEIALGPGIIAPLQVLELVPETVSPLRYERLLPRREVEWLANRAREMDAVAGQIAHAEQLLSIVSEEERQTSRLHKDAWHLARLALAREAARAFSRIALSAWETMSTAAKLTATLIAPESDKHGVALAEPMVEAGSRFAYTDADMALEQAAAEAKEPALVVRVVRCARVRDVTLAARLALRVANDWANTDSGIAVAESMLRELKPISGSSDQQLALADLEARCSICELLHNEYALSSMLRLSMLQPTSPRMEPSELVRLLPPSEDDASLAARIGVTTDTERFVLELSRRQTRRCVRDVDKLVAYGLWDAAESETLRRLARVATVSRLFDGDDSTASLELVLNELEDDEATEAVQIAISRCARPTLLLSSSEERPGVVAGLDDRLAVAERRGLQVARVERRALWGLALLGAPDALLAFSVDDDCQARLAGEARCALVALEVAVAANDLLADEVDARPAMDDTSLADSHRMRRWALEQLRNYESMVNEADSAEDISISINAAVLASRAMTQAERVAAAAAAHAARVFCSKGVATAEEKASVALHLSRQARGLEEKAVLVEVVVALAHEAAAAVCDDARLDAEARRFVAANALRLPHYSPRTVVLLDQWTALAGGDETEISQVEASPTTAEEADELLAKLAASSLPVSSLDELASHASSFAILDERLAQQEANRPKRRRPRKRPQEANEELVVEIAALGFSRNASIRAARAVDNSGLEQALKWSLEHSTDPNFDAPIEPESEDEVEDSQEGDVRRRLAARVSRAYFALAVELAPNPEIQEAARNCEAEARRRCHIVADGAALRQALDEEEYEASAAKASGDERPDAELLVRAARSTTSGTALEKALQVASERGMSAADLAVEHLDSLWDEARRTGELEELSNRLLAAKGSGRGAQAAADAGVSLGPPSATKSPLRAATAKAVSTLRDTDPTRLTEWIKQCYAAETAVEPLKLVCNLAKTYSNEPEFSKRAQLQYLNLNALSRALSRSTSGADVGRLNVKRLLGDLLTTPQPDEDSVAAVNELAKIANADNAIALHRLTPKLKGVSAADVYESAVRNEIARCLSIPLEDEDVHAIELKAILDDRLGRVLSRLVAVGGSAVRAVRAGFAACLGSVPLEAHHTVASAVVRLVADKKIQFDDNGLEGAVVAAARLVSRGFGNKVNALAAANLRGVIPLEQIVVVAAEVAATMSSAEVREIVGFIAGSADEVISAAFDRAALAALALAPPRAVEGIKQLLERAADDEAARSAVLAATRRALDSTPADDTEACQAFAELAALADPSKERQFAVRMILTEVRELGVEVPPHNDDKVPFFRAFLSITPQKISANILWRLLDALSPCVDRQQNRDDELVAAALGDEPEVDDQDDELASCWFELLSAVNSEDVAWLARAGCPPGVTYSRASELRSLDTLRPADAIRFGLLGRFRAVRKEAASRLANFEPQPPLMPDILDIALRSGEALPERLLYSAARAACDADTPASLFESPCFAVALYLSAAHRRQSQADVLVALDLAAQALGVHPGLRTFDAVLLAARSAFARDIHPDRPGWVHWPRLRRLATAALDAYYPRSPAPKKYGT